MDSILNATGMISDSIASAIYYCPSVSVQAVVSWINRYASFSNVTLAQIAESFMFAQLSDAITYRDIYLTINTCSIYNDNVCIVQ